MSWAAIPLSRATRFSSFSGTAPAPGYKHEWLQDGTLGRAFRSALTLGGVIIADGPSSPYDTIAVFGVKATVGTATVVPVALPALPALDARGNAWGPIPTQNTSLNLQVVSSSPPAAFIVEELVAGQRIVVEAQDRAWERDDRFATLRNGDYATKLSERRMHLSMEWAPLTASQHDQVMQVVDATEGGRWPVALIPDLDSPEIYLGTLTDEHPHRQGPGPYHEGHRLIFTELRRPLG